MNNDHPTRTFRWNEDRKRLENSLGEPIKKGQIFYVSQEESKKVIAYKKARNEQRNK